MTEERIRQRRHERLKQENGNCWLEHKLTHLEMGEMLPWRNPSRSAYLKHFTCTSFLT